MDVDHGSTYGDLDTFTVSNAVACVVYMLRRASEQSCIVTNSLAKSSFNFLFTFLARQVPSQVLQQD